MTTPAYRFRVGTEVQRLASAYTPPSGELTVSDGVLFAADGNTPLIGMDPVAKASDVVIDPWKAGVRTSDISSDISTQLDSILSTCPDGSTIRFRSGTYAFNSGYMKNYGKNMKFDMSAGVRFIQTASNPLFSLNGTWDTIYGVSSISVVTITATNPNGLSANTGVHQLNLTSGTTTPTYNIGDVVSVFSDDTIPEARPQRNSGVLDPTYQPRYGQMAVVWAVGAGYVQLMSVLDDLSKMTTNIRVAKLLPVNVQIVGDWHVDMADAAFSNHWDHTLIFCNSLYRPLVSGLTIDRWSSTGLNFKRCWNPLINNLHANYLTNIPSPTSPYTNQLGYVIADNQSEALIATNIHARAARHLYTDLDTSVAVNSTDPSSYGRSRNAILVGCSASGMQATSYGPHCTGTGHTFIGCHSRYSMSNGFALRGKNHRLIDCSSYFDAQGPWQVITDNDGGESYGHLVENFEAEGTDAALLNTTAVTISCHTGTYDSNLGVKSTKTNVTVRGGKYKGYSAVFGQVNTKVDYRGDVDCRMPASVVNGVPQVKLINSDATEIDMTLNYQDVTAAPNAVGFWWDVNSTLTTKRVRFRESSAWIAALPQAIFMAQGSTGTVGAKLNGLEFDLLPADTQIAKGTVLSLPLTEWQYKVNNKASGWTGRKALSNTQIVSTTLIATLQPVTDDMIVLACSSSTSSGYTLAPLQPGHHDGQVLTVKWQNSFGAYLTIANGGNVSNPQAAAVTLIDGQSVSYVSFGGVWYCISSPTVPANVQIFTTSGTWNRPLLGTYVDVLAIGGGDGGASGRRGPSGTAISGGGGGGAGMQVFKRLAYSAVGATEAVAVSVGGAGGAAVTVDSTNGNPGGAPTSATSFGNHVRAYHASTGPTGGNTIASVGGAVSGGVSGGAGPLGAAGGSGGNGVTGPSAGGAGGGISATPAAFNGGAGGILLTALTVGGVGGVVGGAAATSGAGSATGEFNPGSGGGGGASSITGAAGNGGNAGLYGAGGGGGGASLNGSNSGAGGNGAGGLLVAWTVL